MINKKEKERIAFEKEKAIKKLREWCPPGTTLYTSYRHVSRSGMYRVITVLLPYTDKSYGNQILNISGYVSQAIGEKWDDKHGGIGIGGCGYDVGDRAVHSLSYILHGMRDKLPEEARRNQWI